MKTRFCLGVLALRFLLPDAFDATPPQTLAELARKESDRRKALESRGVEGKVIDGHDASAWAPRGNISTSPASTKTKIRISSLRVPRRPSPAKFRSALRKLDREIRTARDRLVVLKERAESKRKAALLRGTRARDSGKEDRLQWQIRELELKLDRLVEDRRDTYQQGRKAGFHPGELDGKGRIR